MIKFSAKLAFVAAFAVLSSASAFAVTQATAPVNYSSYGWNNDLLSEVTFAQGTQSISAITGSTSIADQGWGGEYEQGNQIYLSLDENGTSLWGDHFAGGTHQWRSVDFDISSNAAELTSLNAALSGINWSTTPDVSMQLRSSTIGYPGWALFVSGAQFSVTSNAASAVPEANAGTMLLAGLVGLGFVARRKKLG